MSNDPVTVIVIEDQRMVREGLAALANLADHIEAVATGADGLEALTLVAEYRPDVVLMDIKMPNLDGIEATRQIKQSHPNVNVLVLTTFVQRDLIAQALDVGASGYLTKDISATDLAAAISAAARGLVQLSPAAAARISAGKPRSDIPAPQKLRDAARGLTPREQEVLAVLASGATNAEIAERLNLSSGTIKNHVSSILRQLGLADRTRAAVAANQLGLTPPLDAEG